MIELVWKSFWRTFVKKVKNKRCKTENEENEEEQSILCILMLQFLCNDLFKVIYLLPWRIF